MIADVSGKGIPASLFMMSSMIILRERILTEESPSKILKQANESICKNNKATMFVTVWLGILEISTGKLTASNGGHEYPVVFSGGRFELLDASPEDILKNVRSAVDDYVKEEPQFDDLTMLCLKYFGKASTKDSVQ